MDEKIVAIVKHFRSLNPGSEKLLLVERVRHGSDTAGFLSRMEFKRRSQSCNQIIDMRGKVTEECSSYPHQNRVHFLDERSRVKFEECLDDTDGKYTLGMFEDISTADHTILAQQRKQHEKSAVISKLSLTPIVRKLVDIIPFGYYRKRKQDRLTFITHVELSASDKVVMSSTVDLSLHGLKIRTRAKGVFKENSEIGVSFSGFIEKNGLDSHPPIAYQIIEIRDDGARDLLRLRMIDPNSAQSVCHFLSRFIERFAHKYKLCPEDAMLTVTAFALEQLYLETYCNMPVLFKGGKDVIHSEYIGITNNNSHWTLNSQEDKTPLAVRLLTHDRLAYLLGQPEELNSIVVFSFYYTINGVFGWYTAAQFELEDQESSKLFFSFAQKSAELKAYRVTIDTIPSVSDEKMERTIEFLYGKSPELSRELMAGVAEITHAGGVVDISAMHQDFPGAEEVGLLSRSLEKLVKFRHPGKDGEWPTVVQIGERITRSEPRYILSTGVDVQHPNGHANGYTLDVSIRGLKINLEKSLSLSLNAELKIDLSELTMATGDKTIVNMPYRLTNISRDGRILQLERAEIGSSHPGSVFFKKLLNKNKDKLSVCLIYEIENARSALLEALFAESQLSVPFFISRGKELDLNLAYVSASEASSDMLWFFSIGQEEYDMEAIFNAQFMNTLASYCRAFKQNQPPLSFHVYVYRTVRDEDGSIVFKAMSTLLDPPLPQFEEFIRTAKAAEQRLCLRVNCSVLKPFDFDRIEYELSHLTKISSKKSKTLVSELESLCMAGELIDVTADSQLAD